MKRSKPTFKVDAILTADWHLREGTPICRTDDFQAAQWGKVEQIKDLQRKHQCEIFNAGDLFQQWRVNPSLINQCIEQLKSFHKKMITVIGNHEMPRHNIELMEQSAWEVLYRAKVIEYLGRGDWGQAVKDVKPLMFKNRTIYMMHTMVWQGEAPWPGCEDPDSFDLIDMLPDADLILTGHNHVTFTEQEDGILLVNPGSLTRHKADQVDHQPCVFLYNAESNKVQQHFLEIEQDVISREHIEVNKQKSARIKAFIAKLAEGWDLSLSFEENIERGIIENKIPEKIKEIIREWMDI